MCLKTEIEDSTFNINCLLEIRIVSTSLAADHGQAEAYVAS